MVLFSGKTDIQSENSSRLNRAIDYILYNYNKELSLEKLSEIACLSRYYFHRQFHLIMGETLNDFIRRIRLENATFKLLLDQYKPITEIAYECGFSSSQNFSRSFKAKFSMTPSVMRDNFNWDDTISKLKRAKHGYKSISKEEMALLEYFLKTQNLTIKDILEQDIATTVDIQFFPSCRMAYVRTVGHSFSRDVLQPAFNQMVQWALPKDLIDGSEKLIRGVAWNNNVITPEDKIIFDICLQIPEGTRAGKWINTQTLRGGYYAVYRSEAEIRHHEEQRDLMRLFKWLLFSGYRPDNRPIHFIYHNEALSQPLGRATIDTCIPIKFAPSEFGES